MDGLILLSLLALSADSFSQQLVAPKKRPNVLLLVANDMNWDSPGCFGGAARKPTGVSTTLASLWKRGPRCPGVSEHHHHEPHQVKQRDGEFSSKRLSRYPPDLCQWLASQVIDLFESWAESGLGPSGWRDNDCLQAITSWSCVSSAERPGLCMVNEAVAKSQRYLINQSHIAFYLMPDTPPHDGVPRCPTFCCFVIRRFLGWELRWQCHTTVLNDAPRG